MLPRHRERLDEYDRLIPDLLARARTIRGYLTDKEIRFLALLASFPTAAGTVLEIGSFQGKSTIVLALAGRLAGGDSIVAVDPLTYRPRSDPDKGKKTVLGEFTENLRTAGVENRVEFHQKFSSELAPSWDRKVRLLWIDGDHTYAGASLDFNLYFPHLSDGAIVALHDVMKHDEGPLRVFMENMLLSPHFGANGVCGSIGWGQYRSNPSDAVSWRTAKLRTYRKLTRLVPYLSLLPRDGVTSGWSYKLFRSLIPHGAAEPQRWLNQVAFSPKTAS